MPLTSLVLGALAVLPAQGPWEVGERLPHVHLPTIDGGEAVDLAGFAGKRVLLIEFASW